MQSKAKFSRGPDRSNREDVNVNTIQPITTDSEENSADYPVITISDGSNGPFVQAQVEQHPSVIFLDSGAHVNLINLKYLRKIKPGVVTLDKAYYKIKGVTGNKITPLGETLINITFGYYYRIEAMVVVVQEDTFPGDLLIGFNTMRDEDIDILPSRNGAKISYKFLPFLNAPFLQTAPLGLTPLTREAPEATNSVAERSELPKENKTQSEDTHNVTVNKTKQITAPIADATTSLPHTSSHEPKREKKAQTFEDDYEFYQLVTGTAIQSSVLRAGDISRVRVKLKGIVTDPEVITIPETFNIKGLDYESAIYSSKNGVIEILINNSLNKSLALNKGTLIGHFLVCKFPLKILAKSDNTEAHQPHFVGTVQADGDYGVLRDHLKATDRPELEPQLLKLLAKYRKTVALPGDALGKTSVLKHTIKLKPGTQPIYIPAYRLPHSKVEVAEKLVQEMLEQEVIEPSTSPWNFPLILVPKADGSMRPVVDYRRLNEVTIPDRVPLPLIQDIIRNIGTENVLFSTLDIKSAFWQIELEDSSKDCTAFSTPTGHYRYRRLPYGLSNSPLTYVRLMNHVLSGLIGKSICCFMDDILIFSKTEQEHFQIIEQVLSRLADAGLKIKMEKCNFLKSKITYLGHELSRHGVKALKSKIEAVENYPTPTKTETVRSFLGLTGYYRKYIKGYAEIAYPLSSLLKKNVKFAWGESQQKSFDTLKDKLTHAPLLIYPDYTQEFVLCTDASDIGLGGVLMQHRDGGLKPIAYTSRLCTSAERNYSVTERETLAVIYCLEHFRDIILGYEIKVFTDHMAIQNLFKYKNLRGRLARWFTILQNYDVKFQYIRGNKNTAADALSRNIPPKTSEDTVVFSLQEFVTLSHEELLEEQYKDEKFHDIIEYLRDTDNNDPPPVTIRHGKENCTISHFTLVNDLLYHTSTPQSKEVTRETVSQLVIPQTLVKDVLKLLHDSPTSSHPGRDKTYHQAQLKYFWPKMRQDIYLHVENCLTCAQIKGNPHSPAPILEYPIPSKPWQRIHIDTLELPLSENGYKYLFVAIDYFSRYCILQPIPNKKAETIATTIINQIICNYSTPHTIITDQGSEYVNQIMSELCNQFSIKKVNIHVYRPQSNGVVERLNRKIIHCLRSLINPYSIQWDTWIPLVKCSLNTQINASTGETPHFIVFAEEKELPYDLLNSPPRVIYNPDDYMSMRINKFQQIHQRVKEHMQDYTTEMSNKQHKIAKAVKIKPGDIVMLQRHVPVGESRKLSPKFKGPYKVIEPSTGNKFKVKHLESGQYSIEHNDHLKKTKIIPEDSDSENDDADNKDEGNNMEVDNDNISNPEPIPSTSTEQSVKENNNYRSKLRSHSKIVSSLYVDDDAWKQMENKILADLNIDCNSFYR